MIERRFAEGTTVTPEKTRLEIRRLLLLLLRRLVICMPMMVTAVAWCYLFCLARYCPPLFRCRLVRWLTAGVEWAAVRMVAWAEGDVWESRHWRQYVAEEYELRDERTWEVRDGWLVRG